MHTTLRLQRRLLQNNVLLKKLSFLHHSTVARPFSSTPHHFSPPLSGFTPSQGNVLNPSNHSKFDSRRFSFVSKTRLRDKFFWLVVGGLSTFFAYQVWDNGQDPSLAVMRELQNVSSFEEVIEYWNRINQLLFFTSNWEPFLKSGIVEIGLAQLKEMKDLIPLSLPNIAEQFEKLKTLKEGTAEYDVVAEEMYSFMAPMASAKMISDTLSRLCELESVAERIVEQGGIELLMDFMLTGIDHYYLADLWNSILQHKKINQQILNREGFIDHLEQLAARNDDTSILQVYNTLFAVMRDEDARRLATKDVRILSIVSAPNSAIDFFKFFDYIFAFPLSFWDNQTPKTERTICFKDKRYLRGQVAQELVWGAVAAVYCGLRWKRILPNLATSVLVRKMATAFVGISLGRVAEQVVYYNVVHGLPARAELNTHKIFNDTGDSKFRQFHRRTVEVVEGAGLAVFFLAYYNAKFLILPFFGILIFDLFKLPTKDDITNGKYVKFVMED